MFEIEGAHEMLISTIGISYGKIPPIFGADSRLLRQKAFLVQSRVVAENTYEYSLTSRIGKVSLLENGSYRVY
jgi:hypothetical protein